MKAACPRECPTNDGYRNTIADTASHRCRDENEVREKMKKLGMVENPGKRGSAR
jgi:hypothetical protein